MFAMAGHGTADGFSDALLDDLVVWGDADEIVDQLHRWLCAGVGAPGSGR